MSHHEIGDFETDVLDRSREVPVVVDFWAEWCGPCKVIGPVLEKLAREADGQWELVKVDTEQHGEIATTYRIRSIPAVKLFVDGEVVDEFVGALPEPAIREWLETALPGPHAARVAEADRLLDEGRDREARDLLGEILESEPGNAAARVLLARSLLCDEPAEARETLEGIDAASSLADTADALRTLAHVLERAADPEDLPDGSAGRAWSEAVRALDRRDWAAALDGFIDVIQLDRTFQEDGARRACLAIFELLGRDHPAVRDRRMAFSNAVHA